MATAGPWCCPVSRRTSRHRSLVLEHFRIGSTISTTHWFCTFVKLETLKRSHHQRLSILTLSKWHCYFYNSGSFLFIPISSLFTSPIFSTSSKKLLPNISAAFLHCRPRVIRSAFAYLEIYSLCLHGIILTGTEVYVAVIWVHSRLAFMDMLESWWLFWFSADSRHMQLTLRHAQSSHCLLCDLLQSKETSASVF